MGLGRADRSGLWGSNWGDGIAGRRPSSDQTVGTLRDSNALSNENQLETAADRTETWDKLGSGGKKQDRSQQRHLTTVISFLPNLSLINQSPRPYHRLFLGSFGSWVLWKPPQQAEDLNYGMHLYSLRTNQIQMFPKDLYCI